MPRVDRDAGSATFSTDCRRCPRLVGFLDGIRRSHPGYYARPVPSFGDPDAALLVVGLAPGLHGANATGRPFTGDFAGGLLYETLHEYGFASEARSRAAGDGLQLASCRITNAVRCVPPGNKPSPEEVRNCNDYLRDEIARLPPQSVVVALGVVAHGAVLRVLGLRARSFPFAHAAEHDLRPRLWLLDSYHCSRYNTQTRRLTPEMFHAVFARARALLAGAGT